MVKNRCTNLEYKEIRMNIILFFIFIIIFILLYTSYFVKRFFVPRSHVNMQLFYKKTLHGVSGEI